MSMATRTDTQSPALHVADSHDLIRVQGARENNLKDVSVETTRGPISDVVPATSTGRCKSSSEILLNLRTSVLHHVVRSQSKHPLLTDRT
jgi:excinuclease UvrABC ATPase subunit